MLATTKQSVSASDREELTSVLQSEDVADARDYLNALVEESVSTDDPQVRQKQWVLLLTFII